MPALNFYIQQPSLASHSCLVRHHCHQISILVSSTFNFSCHTGICSLPSPSCTTLTSSMSTQLIRSKNSFFVFVFNYSVLTSNTTSNSTLTLTPMMMMLPALHCHTATVATSPAKQLRWVTMDSTHGRAHTQTTCHFTTFKLVTI